MEASFLAAVKVSILAMVVIFTVLIILIFTIKLLVKLIPYVAPPPAPPRHQTVSATSSDQEEHIAAITATLAIHLGKSPSEFRIVNISQN
ncbi:MAG: OadG family protein [Nitrospina sp.]|jgi:sodium pump decarboxylase gamma subunit|nr:OadG family protein [Nitrospina sp.]MBT5631681.1 OadG family protein [Nitrospina sp.]